MTELISITQADRRFFRVGLIGGTILITFFILQSLGGKFGEQVAATWGMILLFLVPVTVTVVILQFTKTPTRQVNRSFFRLIYRFYVFYLLTLFAVWLFQPFFVPPPGEDGSLLSPGLFDALLQASYALIPMQLILIGLLVGFNFRKGPVESVPAGEEKAGEEEVLPVVDDSLREKMAPIHDDLMNDLQEGRIDVFFEKLHNFCQENEVQFHYIVPIKDNWRRNENDRHAGTVSTEEYARHRARTLLALIHFMEEFRH